MKLLSNLKSDFFGGFAAAVIALPTAIVFGMMAFEPLGSQFASQAAMAGLNAAIVAGGVAALLGGSPIQISGPRASLALVITSVSAGLLQSSASGGPAQLQVHDVVTLSFFCVFLGGLFQVLFGLLRLGALIKFTPYPVYAGLMNGIALLLVGGQLKPLLGVPRDVPLMILISDPGLAQPATLVVGLVTLAAIVLAVPLRRKLPPPLVGILAGSLAYHVFVHLKPDVRIGGLTGSFEAALPAPLMLHRFVSLADNSRLANLLTILFVPAIILALLASMDSLISAMAADRHTGHRHDSKRELLGQGVGNMVSACFGGITVAGSVPRTTASYEAGGRTRLAGLFSSGFLLAAALLLGPLVGKIPLVVVAAVLAAIGVGLFDSWTIGLVGKLTKDSWRQREIVNNLAVSFFVTAVTVSAGLIFAVALAFVFASALFIAKMGKTVVRRKYRAERIRSKVTRPLHDLRILEREGGRILVFELQGPIFFGSADTLASEVDESAGEAAYVILDLRNVNEIDSTGANILRQIARRLVRDGKLLLLSRADGSHPLGRVLKDLDVIDEIGAEFVFPDTDGALEWCEERILARSGARAESGGRLPLEEIPLLREFSGEEREELGRRMSVRTFRPGEKVIGEGDRDRDLLILTSGKVSVTTRLLKSNRRKRLVTFSPGVIVGEIAFLDGSPRSADVRADEAAEMLSLSLESFDELRRENPVLAMKLMASIAGELSQRLRVTSNEVRELEEL